MVAQSPRARARNSAGVTFSPFAALAASSHEAPAATCLKACDENLIDQEVWRKANQAAQHRAASESHVRAPFETITPSTSLLGALSTQAATAASLMALSRDATGRDLGGGVAAADSCKPLFHVMPRSGWGSDPNGPIFYKGRYHLFYQARPGTCQWYWGMCWDHVVSTDLAHWERLPTALAPTPGGIDADGCFSGSIQVEPQSGIPVCFYTAARLRTNREVTLPHPPPSHDMGLKHIETQCCAICDPDDDLLVRWRKVPMPLMELPHTGQLTAWRDPWFVEQGDGKGREWTMLIGSGLKDAGGTALVYRTADITRGWRFEGYLCTWPNPGTGICWECPFLIQLQPLPLCAHVLPTVDLSAPAAAPTAAVAKALNSAQQQLADSTPPAQGQAAGGTWTATAHEHSAAAAVMAAAAAVAAAAAEAGSSPDAALSATAAGVAAAVVADADSASEPNGGAGGTATDGTVADSSWTTLSTDSGRRTSIADDTEVLSVYDAYDTMTNGGDGDSDGGDDMGHQVADSDRDGDSRRRRTTQTVTAPPTVPPPVPRERTALAVGFVDTLLQVVTSVTSTAAISGGGSDAEGADGGGGIDALLSLSPAAAEAAGGGGFAAHAAADGGIGVSVTAAAPAHDGDGNVADGAPTVTITVTRAAAATDGGKRAGANGAATDDVSVTMGSITTATATVRGGGDDRTPATATIQVCVTPFTTTSKDTPADAVDVSSGTAMSTPAAGEESAAAQGLESTGSKTGSITLTSRTGSLRTSTLTASATVSTASAADRAVLQDLHSMIKQVMEAHRVRAAVAAASDAAATSPSIPSPSPSPSPLATGTLHYHPGVVGHSVVPEPETELVPLPGHVTMRYHKAQPLLMPGASYSAAASMSASAPAASASALPQHGDVESATTHAHAPTLPEHRRWFFCCAPDACTYSIIYWISEYDSRTAKYDMEASEAGGRPRKLDMGNVLYAPTCFTDPKGRHVLWGYMKELRNVPAPPCRCNKYSYAGCVSLPRALYLRGDRLFQLPLPELTALRSDVAVHASRVELTHGSPWRLADVHGLHLDMEISVSPGSARQFVVLFRSWRPRGRGATALVYDWTSRTLRVVFEAMHPSRRAHWGGGQAEAAASAQCGKEEEHEVAQGCQSADNASSNSKVDGSLAQPVSAPKSISEIVKSKGSGARGAEEKAPHGVRQEEAEVGNGAGTGVHESDVARKATVAGEQQSLDGTLKPERGLHVCMPEYDEPLEEQVVMGSPAVETTCLPAEMAAEGRGEGSAAEEEEEEELHGNSGGSEEVQGGGVGAGGDDVAGPDMAEEEEDEADEEENTEFEVIRDPDFIPDPDMNPLVEEWIRMKREEAGGVLAVPPSSPLRLRLFLDASCLEVFTGSGQVLTTRVYRGHPPKHHHTDPQVAAAGPDSGIELMAVGGSCVLDDLHVYEVHSAWPRMEDVPGEDL